jgi:hypothetical protein
VISWLVARLLYTNKATQLWTLEPRRLEHSAPAGSPLSNINSAARGQADVVDVDINPLEDLRGHIASRLFSITQTLTYSLPSESTDNMTTDTMTDEHTLYAPPKKSVVTLLRENPYVLGLACVSFLNLSPNPLHTD